jgi:hypothetical protein
MGVFVLVKKMTQLLEGILSYANAITLRSHLEVLFLKIFVCPYSRTDSESGCGCEKSILSSLLQQKNPSESSKQIQHTRYPRMMHPPKQFRLWSSAVILSDISRLYLYPVTFNNYDSITGSST